MSKKKKKRRQESKIACEGCEALCCRYVAIEIDKPETKRDHDHVRWYLLHKNVFVFIDHEGDWYVEFETDCAELQPDGRCGRYSARPRICRRHGEEESVCEFHSDEPAFKKRFATCEEFERYLDRRGIKWRWKKRHVR